MIKVTAFQTTDGKIHESELNAIRHEQLIELKNVAMEHFQSTNSGAFYNVANIAGMVATMGTRINDINKKYAKKIDGCVRRLQSKSA